MELQRPATGAPRPTQQSTPGWKVKSRTEYDAFGNAIFTAGPNGQCGQVGYDAAYAQLPETEVVYAGQPGFDVVIGHATYDCGTTLLTASAKYDRGLGAVLRVKDVNGAASRVEYDGFGRIRAMFGPRLDHPEEPSDTASLLVEYRLPDQTLRPVSMLVSRTLDGATIDDATYHESYAYIDGLGRTIVTLSEADPDPTKDGFGWVVQGLTDYDLKGAERRKYLAWEYSEEPGDYDLSVASPAKYGQQRYDAFGRAIATYGLDGHLTLQTRYHALSADAWDGEDIGPGPHAGTYASEEKDGHGRVIKTTERVRIAGGVEPRHVEMVYAITGEPLSITRRRGTEQVSRQMFYDSLGQLVQNQMPETGTWRYAYDDSGQLVGTEDPRGCGTNYAYDTAGRLLSEDYSPCEPHHAVYSAAPEVLYEYDDPAFDRIEAFTAPAGEEQNCQALNFTRGRLVAVTDRAQRSLTCYDGRGRTVEAAKQLAQPGGVIDGRWYNRRAAYDGADRPTVETTGVGTSVTTTYTRRGAVDHVTSSYGLLVDHVTRDADGLVKEIEYGDAAKTTTSFTYDDLRRLRNLTTYRASLDGWTPTAGTQQMLLQDEEFTYDRVGNPVEIRDWRDPDEWPAGAKPVTRKLRYDSLYRLSRVDYQYGSGADDWKDPYAAEVLDNSRPQPAPRAKFAASERVQWQTYEYDWLGNTAQTHDDLDAFYDRSLGTVTNQGYQLKSATSQVGARSGSLDAQYDVAGNLVVMNVGRSGACTVVGGCADQRFEYAWDEVGRLVRARRFDAQDQKAELTFTYDASDQRVRKTSGSKHTLYIFGSLELRYADHDGTDYVQDEFSEVPYLFAHGVRLARVVTRDGSTHVFLELGDHLGSTSVVLDRATGELVERTTAYAYGEVESSLRPGKFEEFREDYRFTGKEDDVEVGLIYFGKRFYAPLLQRWISPDPLAIHAPGKADLNLYAYVHGRVLVAVDPVGLAEGDESPKKGVLVFAYGSGQLSPNRADDASSNLRGAFEKAARAEMLQRRAALGPGANQYEFVMVSTPERGDLIEALNKDYGAPIKELHVFSHGWEEGLNLGGIPVPAGQSAPKTDTAERRFTAEDFDKVHARWESKARVTFYGCNIGNRAKHEPPFAQQFSDRFGVRVTASTSGTWFPNGPRQRPNGGRMIDFTPSNGARSTMSNRAGTTASWLAHQQRSGRGGVSRGAKGQLREQIAWLERAHNSTRPPSPNSDGDPELRLNAIKLQAFRLGVDMF